MNTTLKNAHLAGRALTCELQCTAVLEIKCDTYKRWSMEEVKCGKDAKLDLLCGSSSRSISGMWGL